MTQTLSATELRIGNIIYNPNLKENRTLDILDIRDFAEGRLYIPFEPIPLTPEWLERFHFIADNYNVFYKTETNEPKGRCQLWCHHFKKDDDVIWDCHIGQEFGELTFVLEIKYVHQLMNLYFALTGSELSLKR